MKIKRTKSRYIDPATQFLDIEKYNKKIQVMRNDEIKFLIFQEFLVRCNNIKQNQKSILSFFM